MSLVKLSVSQKNREIRRMPRPYFPKSPYFPKPRAYFSKSFISRNPILFPEIVDLHGLDSGASCFAAPQARKFWVFYNQERRKRLISSGF